MAEFSMDKMARSVAERAMEVLKDSGVFDEDVVSREAVRQGMVKYGFHAPDMTVTEFVEDELLPAISNQKTGKWIIDEAETNLYALGTRIWACHCSECGKDPQDEYIAGTENWWLSKLPNFCPNCGAKMEGEIE